MELFNPDDTSRYDNFNIITKTYKTVGRHSIELDILFSKNISATSYQNGKGAPILLRYHGGGFTAASSLFPPFFPPWLLQLAEKYSAIIVSPNYRLFPESSLQDAVDDVNDALLWVRDSLRQCVSDEIPFDIDVDKIMVAGDSAGGYMALLVALEHPDLIRSVFVSYPAIDVRSPHFIGGYEKQTLGATPFPATLINEYVDRMKQDPENSIISADPRGDRVPLMLSLVQHGLMGDMFPEDQRRLHPLLKLDDGQRFPRGGVVILHGENDTVVPIEGSFKLRDKVCNLDPGLKLRVVVRKGDHGFDHEADITEEWMSESLEDVTQAWITE